MTDKKVDTWMPLLVDKYLGDTTHLSTEQHGAYVLLLLTMWKRGGELPDDDEQLLNITRLRPERWKASRATLRAFFDAEDGVLRQKRLTVELARARANLGQRVEAGKASAAARKAAREANETATAVATGVATDGQRDPQRNGRPTPTPSSLRSEIDVPSALVDPPSARLPNCPTEALIDLYHQHLPMLPRVEILNDTRRKHLAARWKDVVSDKDMKDSADVRAAGIDWFAWYFARVATSRFLTGQAKDWRADLDFLITQSKFAKVLEGRYHKEAA